MNHVIEAQMSKFSKEHSLEGYEQDILFEKFSIFTIARVISLVRVIKFGIAISSPSKFGFL